MTKELQELFSEASCMISQLGRYNGNDNEYQARKALRSIEAYISEFFSQNVCIPKGENRQWSDSMQYRIKPTESVYEYLYYSRIGNTIWSTKEDAPSNMWCAEETKRVRNA